MSADNEEREREAWARIAERNREGLSALRRRLSALLEEDDYEAELGEHEPSEEQRASDAFVARHEARQHEDVMRQAREISARNRPKGEEEGE